MTDTKKHVHLLGICGTGMTALASLLKEAGHEVTGSDQNVYPPMSTRLEELGITVFEGYRPENLSNRPDLVVVGNVIRKDNPEAQEAMKLGLPYRSMPQALADFFLSNRTPVVIAGTHGKSTLATLTSWILEAAGENPGFFVGAIGRNLNTGARIGSGPFFIVEGDEYDTAFFDKGPKFVHYRPQAVILTSIEFDHADIYRDIDHLMESFRKLVRLIPPDGMLIACADYDRVREVASEAHCKVITYGLEDADYLPADIMIDEAGTTFTVTGPRGTATLRSPLFGAHNLQNALAASALLIESGMSAEKIQVGLDSFQGLARRQEIVGEEKSVTVIDDFAHHPTAVQKTIDATHERYPGRRLWAIFEPRSNTSRRNIFQNAFFEAFANADRVVIADVFKPETIPAEERLDVAKLADDLMRSGIDAHFVPDADHIVEYVLRCISANDVVLVMSNGSFDGVPRKLLEGLKKRKIV